MQDAACAVAVLTFSRKPLTFSHKPLKFARKPLKCGCVCVSASENVNETWLPALPYVFS